MRSTGNQGSRNPKGTYVAKDDLAVGLARRRAYRPMRMLSEKKIPLLTRTMLKKK